MPIVKYIPIFAAAALFAGSAPAQTSYVSPRYGGGYTITTPGQQPTFLTPNYGGGYTVVTPGQPPSFIVPTTPPMPTVPPIPVPSNPYQPYGYR